MDNLQTAIISKYQSTFPKDTLQQISDKTEIQITRVFRILNGSEMKVSEYEAFENAINLTDTKQNQYFNLSKECYLQLSSDKLSYLTNLMIHSLKLNQFQLTESAINQKLELA